MHPCAYILLQLLPCQVPFAFGDSWSCVPALATPPPHTGQVAKGSSRNRPGGGSRTLAVDASPHSPVFGRKIRIVERDPLSIGAMVVSEMSSKRTLGRGGPWGILWCRGTGTNVVRTGRIGETCWGGTKNFRYVSNWLAVLPCNRIRGLRGGHPPLRVPPHLLRPLRAAQANGLCAQRHPAAAGRAPLDP